MELDSFLVEKRWEILRILSKSPTSPIELAEILETTVSYVSQQLKLLEAMGLVRKTRTGAVEKGKPRSVYSLSQEFAYITLLSYNNSSKKRITLTSHHKAILNIWLLDDVTLHFPIEKLFFKLENFLGEIDGVFIEQGFVPKVLIISESKTLKTKVDSAVKAIDKKISYSFISKSGLSHLPSESLLVLHDPNNILHELKMEELKREK
jgi:DNA-binding transcriptional ArsR family regulator